MGTSQTVASLRCQLDSQAHVETITGPSDTHCSAVTRTAIRGRDQTSLY